MTTDPQDISVLCYDVVIVGGGAVGMALAYYLRSLDTGCRVAVVERDPTYQFASTPRASGGIRRLSPCPRTSSSQVLAFPSSSAFPN
jgi:FAD-dependent oxidoreductase domain-containing protein 1